MATFQMVSTSDATFDEIYEALARSYPDACVCTLDRVSNPALELRFEARKAAMEQAGLPVRVMRLFHGTLPENVRGIADLGFLSSKNVASAYGRGTYFARDAKMSSKYAEIDHANEMSYMFVCDVLVGRLARGSCNAVLKTSEFDNFVDSLKDPKIVVTPHDDGALPRYLVAFHKNARQ